MLERLSLGLPAWFGKLPGTGDFAYRRMDSQFQNAWDEWLQHGLLGVRTQVADWVTPYLNAPIWFFALGEGVIGESAWVGVMMPSVDKVGRYFPLTLVSKLTDIGLVTDAEACQEIARWWSRCAQLSAEALHADLDSNSFESMLQSNFSIPIQSALQAPVMHTFPALGYSHWIAQASELGLSAYSIVGLPKEQAFSMLFGYDEETTNSIPLLP